MIFQFRNSLLVIVFIVLIVSFVYVLTRPDVPPDAPVTISTGSSRLSELLGSEAPDGYPMALQAREFRFPEDHGPHPEFRNEWWYVTGNLDDENGGRIGYELTLFRFALTPREDLPDESVSAWKTSQIYIGHFAVSDVRSGEFHVAQRYSRGAARLAGAQAVPFRVWLDDWTIEQAANPKDGWRLHAVDNGVEIDLVLDSRKPPVLNGEDGLSRKSSKPGNASYYYSLTRLQTKGTIRIEGQESAVSGMSWLDREWGSSALSQDQVGWDWFALQLSDGTDLMFYSLRRNDGTRDLHSSGTYTDVDGTSRHLGNDQVRIEVLDYWDSEHGGRYPNAWALEIPEKNIRLEITPVIDNQELITTVRYWEGAVDVRGMSGTDEISGRGYVELTGYAE